MLVADQDRSVGDGTPIVRRKMIGVGFEGKTHRIRRPSELYFAADQANFKSGQRQLNLPVKPGI